MKSSKFLISCDKKPAGDQIKAIKKILKGLSDGARHQTLLGVTGSGKTFTVANVISKFNKPTLVLAHNKTLAAQLVQEYRQIFPNSAVEYFVSYYDHYQPEAYMPISDTYIEKEALINKEIDKLRHTTTQSLLTRNDVIVVSSVSAIYGLGSPKEYKNVHIKISKGLKLSREDVLKKIISIYFERTNGELKTGSVRVISDSVEVMPINEEVIFRIQFLNDKINKIVKINSLTRAIIEEDVPSFFLFPAKHFVTNESTQKRAINNIKKELKEQLSKFKKENKILEAERLRKRTLQDISLIQEVGYCNGIENYSRFFDNRKSGEASHTLLSYFPHKNDGSPDFLTIIDESHVAIPQIQGMFAGDRARKNTLIEHGFRLPSARDNRPLTFHEFNEKVGQIIYTTATPGDYEKEKSGKYIIEQIIRPTGLIDPILDVNPVSEKGKYKGQISHFIQEAKKEIKKGNRVLVTTLTKKTAEDLSNYLIEIGIKTNYVHSDIKTLERIEILTDFRKGIFDILVGVNLLREGLDLPEVTLVAILDADKEGFLRSTTSLIQTIGRAARNVDGRVLLYADNITGSIKKSIEETERRREIQIEHNKKNNITPRTIKKKVSDIMDGIQKVKKDTVNVLLSFDIEKYKKAPKKTIKEKERRMMDAVGIMDFETAAIIRDEIEYLKNLDKK